MVTDAVIAALAAVFGGLLSIMPGLSVPDALQAGGAVVTWIADAGQWAGKLSNWIPISQAVAALGFLMLAVLAAATIRITRVVVSFFSGGGGGAA